MTRVSPRQLRNACAINPLLARLLPICRDLSSARNELRWLREHALASAPSRAASSRRLGEMCERRRRGIPLQYILGTQPFGDLDIRCARGVLIPRPETEAYTVHLAELLERGKLLSPRPGEEGKRLSIVDFCTGTGCIPLLLSSLLARRFPELAVHGVDISPRALRLSRANLEDAVAVGHIPPLSSSQMVTFHRGDVLSVEWIKSTLTHARCDVLVSNPPYVSSRAWKFGRGELSYSARKYEPRLALVPGDDLTGPSGCRHEDLFYAALLDAVHVLDPGVALFEFGDAPQGLRVLEMAMRHPSTKDAEYELWRDYPDLDPSAEQPLDDIPRTIHRKDEAGGIKAIPVRGCGYLRSILIRKPSP